MENINSKIQNANNPEDKNVVLKFKSAISFLLVRIFIDIILSWIAFFYVSCFLRI